MKPNRFMNLWPSVLALCLAATLVAPLPAQEPATPPTNFVTQKPANTQAPPEPAVSRPAPQKSAPQKSALQKSTVQNSAIQNSVKKGGKKKWIIIAGVAGVAAAAVIGLNMRLENESGGIF
jgi:hypothetical protein